MKLERDLIRELSQALRDANWDVQAEAPGKSPSRYDLVATAPSGRTLLLEVKTGRGSTHFAALAQVERYAQEWKSLRGQDVYPVLVTTQHVSPTLEGVAARVGVGVVELAEEAGDVDQRYGPALAQLRKLATP